MKVRTKLSIGFSVIVLLIWVTVFFATNRYTKMNEELELLTEDVIPCATLLADIEDKAQEIKSLTLFYISEGNITMTDRPVKEWIQERMELIEELAKEHSEHATVLDSAEQNFAEELESRVKLLNAETVEVMNLTDSGLDLNELTEEMGASFDIVLLALLKQLQEREAEYMEELAKVEEAAQEAHTAGTHGLLLAAGLATLLAAAIAFSIARSIVKPLHALHKGTEIIGQGNLDYKVGTEAKDEIGQLSRAFDKMTADLGRTTISIDKLNKEITERKRIEQELQEKNERLDAQNEKLRATEEELLSAKEQLEDRVKERTAELEAANNELRETQEQLVRSEKLAAIGQLAGGVGHELRNPLGAIKNAVYYVREKVAKNGLGQKEPRIMEFLDIVDDEITASNKIISDLLGFSRVGKPSVSPARIEKIIEDALSYVPIPENIELVKKLDTELPEIEVDADQIRQVLVNLVTNAIQAMPEGGKLTITVRQRDGFVEVKVSDTGYGIPRDTIGKIFDPLFTTKAKGIGLGLAVCRTIIERHQGQIEAESEIEKGTTFTMKLHLP